MVDSESQKRSCSNKGGRPTSRGYYGLPKAIQLAHDPGDESFSSIMNGWVSFAKKGTDTQLLRLCFGMCQSHSARTADLVHPNLIIEPPIEQVNETPAKGAGGLHVRVSCDKNTSATPRPLSTLALWCSHLVCRH